MNGIGSGGAGEAPRRPADARVLIDLADQIGSEHLSVEGLAGARRRALITACAALVLFVAGIALIPAFILGKVLAGTTGEQRLSFFGISILIAVGVAIETVKQIDGQLMMRNYEGFLNTKSKAKSSAKS